MPALLITPGFLNAGTERGSALTPITRKLMTLKTRDLAIASRPQSAESDERTRGITPGTFRQSWNVYPRALVG
jgi:hypothetical protein